VFRGKADPACTVCNGALNLLSQVGAPAPRGEPHGWELPTHFLLAQDRVDHHEHRRVDRSRSVPPAGAMKQGSVMGGSEVRTPETVAPLLVFGCEGGEATGLVDVVVWMRRSPYDPGSKSSMRSKA
jgi:hypothetical protein